MRHHCSNLGFARMAVIHNIDGGVLSSGQGSGAEREAWSDISSKHDWRFRNVLIRYGTGTMGYIVGHGSGSGMGYITHFHEISERVSGKAEWAIFWDHLLVASCFCVQTEQEQRAEHMCATVAFVLYHEAGWLVRWLDGCMHGLMKMFYAGS